MSDTNPIDAAQLAVLRLRAAQEIVEWIDLHTDGQRPYPSGDPEAIINNAVKKFVGYMHSYKTWRELGERLNIATSMGIQWNRAIIKKYLQRAMGLTEDVPPPRKKIRPLPNTEVAKERTNQRVEKEVFRQQLAHDMEQARRRDFQKKVNK